LPSSQANPGHVPPAGPFVNLVSVIRHNGIRPLYKRALGKCMNYALHTSVPYAAFFVTKNHFFPELPIFDQRIIQHPKAQDLAMDTLRIAASAGIPAALLAIPLHPAQNIRKILFETMASNHNLKPPTVQDITTHIEKLGGFGTLWRGTGPFLLIQSLQ